MRSSFPVTHLKEAPHLNHSTLYIQEALFVKNPTGFDTVFLRKSNSSYSSVLVLTALLLHQSPNIKLSDLSPSCCDGKPAF